MGVDIVYGRGINFGIIKSIFYRICGVVVVFGRSCYMVSIVVGVEFD